LFATFIDLGHNVVEFDYNLQDTFRKADKNRNKSFISKNRTRITCELLKQIKKAHEKRPIDLFFSYFSDACVLPEGIDEIRGMGITTVNWYCNGSYQFHLVEEISPHYDWCLVPEKFRLQDYAAIGARPIYCQEAANPAVYKPYSLPVEFDVSFVGQAYGDRPEYVKYLLDHGINIFVWGYGWDRLSQAHRWQRANALCRFESTVREFVSNTYWVDALRRLVNRELFVSAKNTLRESPGVSFSDEVIGGILSDVDMVKMYSRSKINLGFSSCGETYKTQERLVQIRLRDFEVPMSGGFYMVEYLEELEEYFEIGAEIVCYTSQEDLLDKVNYYLKNDSERERIRRAGHERCLRDHTWQKRFARVFGEMGLV
jgi:spore maturation protein CgeB